MKLVWHPNPPRSTAWLMTHVTEQYKLVLIVEGDERTWWKRRIRRRPMVVGVLAGAQEGRGGRIHDILVHPEFRREGIATRLVCEAIRDWSQTGVLTYSTFPANETSQALLAKLGFVPRGSDYILTIQTGSALPGCCPQ